MKKNTNNLQSEIKKLEEKTKKRTEKFSTKKSEEL